MGNGGTVGPFTIRSCTLNQRTYRIVRMLLISLMRGESGPCIALPLKNVPSLLFLNYVLSSKQIGRSPARKKSRETLGLYTFTVGKIVGITVVTLPGFSITGDRHAYHAPRGSAISTTATKTSPPTARLFIFSLSFLPLLLIGFITFRLKYAFFGYPLRT